MNSDRWFCVHGHMASDRCGVPYYDKDIGSWHLLKAPSERSAIKWLSRHDKFTEYGSWFEYGAVVSFSTETEARAFIDSCKRGDA